MLLKLPASLLDSFEAVARAVEEPLGTTSTLAMWHLVAMARRDVTVALTGQGSDEPWGGYLLYQSELLRNRIPFSCLAGKLAALLKLHMVHQIQDCWIELEKESDSLLQVRLY